MSDDITKLFKRIYLLIQVVLIFNVIASVYLWFFYSLQVPIWTTTVFSVILILLFYVLMHDNATLKEGGATKLDWWIPKKKVEKAPEKEKPKDEEWWRKNLKQKTLTPDKRPIGTSIFTMSTAKHVASVTISTLIKIALILVVVIAFIVGALIWVYKKK